MLSKGEIEEYREILYNLIADENVYGSIKKAVEGTFMYLGQLEQQNKALGNGQHSLMQSRRKWKNRYYKERRKRKEADKAVKQIYSDYQDIGKMYFDLDEIVQKLIEKLEKRIKELKSLGANGVISLGLEHELRFAKEILSFLKGEKNE